MQEKYDQLDRLLRKGRSAEVREALVAWADGRVARRDVVRFARLAWRAWMPELGLRLLHPIVRPPATKPPVRATPEEKAEYAQCLIHFGAVEEGRKLLEDLSESEHPQVLFYKMTALVREWNYRDSIPLLERYIRSKGVTAYQKLVAKVNLAAALAYDGRFLQADVLLRELLYRSSLQGYRHMQERVLEICGQNFLAQRKWDEARKFLDEARSRLERPDAPEALFIRVFQAFLDFARLKGGSGSREALHGARAEALARGNWEIVRNCDYLEAVELRDEGLLRHVYFGTPYPWYRERLLAHFGPVDAAALARYAWNPRQRSEEGPLLSVFTCEYEGTKVLPPGGLLQRLLIVLISDFYRPLRFMEIYSRLYPGQHYNPETSPWQVYNAATRLRQVFENHRIPLTLVEEGGFYRLTADAPVVLVVEEGELMGERHAVPLEKIRSEWPHEPFSPAEAKRVAGVSERSLLRALQHGMSNGIVERLGRGRATRYRFVK